MEFLCHRGAAHDATSFEYGYLEAAGREIRGSNEAVVAAADDERITLCG
jgi:hypothetical protein